MRLDPEWFGRTKALVIEMTALISLILVAAALIVEELKHLFF